MTPGHDQPGIDPGIHGSHDDVPRINASAGRARAAAGQVVARAREASA